MRHQLGLTVVELMVAVSVFAIMATTGVPAMAYFISSQHQLSTKDALLSSLRTARDEAQRRSIPVMVCPATATGNLCGTNWTSGWLVYIDKDNDSKFGSADQLLEQHLDAKGSPVSTTTASLQFKANGMASQTLFNVCADGNRNTPYQITVTSTGRVYVEEKGSASC